MVPGIIIKSLEESRVWSCGSASLAGSRNETSVTARSLASGQQSRQPEPCECSGSGKTLCDDRHHWGCSALPIYSRSCTVRVCPCIQRMPCSAVVGGHVSTCELRHSAASEGPDMAEPTGSESITEKRFSEISKFADSGLTVSAYSTIVPVSDASDD